MKIPHIPSIRVRLTLLLGIIALAVSCAAGWILYMTLQREVQRQGLKEAANKAEVIERLVDMQTEREQLSALKGTLDSILAGHGKMRAWIIGDQGQLFYGGGIPTMLESLSENQVYLRTQDGVHMPGLRVDLENSIVPRAKLTVAVNVEPSPDLLYAFVTALFAICAFWVGATVLLSTWAVRRTLIPLRRLSAQAALIQPNDLTVRLPLEGVDSELREISSAFNSTLDRLQAAYQQLKGFNADVAHELRTPLATLINGTEIILSSTRSAGELRAVMESNLEELEGLKALINDMLFLARADRGERAGDLTQVRFKDEVERVAEYYEAALEEAQLCLNQEGDCEFTANPRLVRRAIGNLLSNAIKACPSGQVIEVRCTVDADQLAIHVCNPGTPIAAEDLARIFDRFYRAGPSRHRSSEGSGLGLAIVQAIARMHGGDVFASSDAERTEIGFTISRKPCLADESSQITKS